MRKFMSWFRSPPPRWLNSLMRRVWIGAALFALVGVGALALRAAPITKGASPVAFLAAGDAPTPTETPTDTPPVPTDTPLPAPTATQAPDPTDTPLPAPVASFSHASVTESSVPHTYTVEYTITTAPAAPAGDVSFSTSFCGAAGGGASGVLDGNGVLTSTWTFKADCADAPFDITVTFGGYGNGHTISGSATIHAPAWS